MTQGKKENAHHVGPKPGIRSVDHKLEHSLFCLKIIMFKWLLITGTSYFRTDRQSVRETNQEGISTLVMSPYTAHFYSRETTKRSDLFLVISHFRKSSDDRLFIGYKFRSSFLLSSESATSEEPWLQTELLKILSFSLLNPSPKDIRTRCAIK